MEETTDHDHYNDEYTNIEDENYVSVDTTATPIVTVEPQKRTIEKIDLSGVVYEVRRPKTNLSDGPVQAMMQLGAVEKRIRQRNDEIERAQKSGRPAPPQLHLDDEIDGDMMVDAVKGAWGYLSIALMDEEDYAHIRRRVYGDISDEDAESDNPVPWDMVTLRDSDPDLDENSIVYVASNLMVHWGQKNNPVKKSSYPTPPRPQKKQPQSAKKPTVRKVRR